MNDIIPIDGKYYLSAYFAVSVFVAVIASLVGVWMGEKINKWIGGQDYEG